MNQETKRAFAEVLGKPCWNVRSSIGTVLYLEFGRPHLVIREPIKASRGVTARVREALARRRVNIHGQWSLGIYYCNWEVRSKGRLMGGCSSKRSKRRAADFLDGQKLMRIIISPRKVQTIFVFELGTTLKTWPYDEDGEQWDLFTPSRKVLTLRADGSYSYGRRNIPSDRKNWKRV